MIYTFDVTITSLSEGSTFISCDWSESLKDKQVQKTKNKKIIDVDRVNLGKFFKLWRNAVKNIVYLQTTQSKSGDSSPLDGIQKVKKEQEWMDQMESAEKNMQLLGVIVKDKKFLIPEADDSLAKNYNLFVSGPYLRCFGYVSYQLNMPMESLFNPISQIPYQETRYLRQVSSPIPGDVVLYWSQGCDLDSVHAGIVYSQIQKTWQIFSKWGLGPVLSHPIDLYHPDYSSGYVFFRPKYGIPLYRQIADLVKQVFAKERTSHLFHPMLPSPLSPLGVAKHWKQWIEDTDSSMPLFTKAAMGERTREVCAKQFFSDFSPILQELQKNPWVYSRVEVSSKIEHLISELDRKMYGLLFSSFWTKIPFEKMDEKSRHI